MKTKHNVTVVKASGDRVVFEIDKLIQSLKRTGANPITIQNIVDKVKTILYDGISTKEIYKTAFTLLRKSSRPTAARYELKNAILELGPTGYPFEKYVEKLLIHQGFRTKVGSIEKGHCVSHEIDVIAEKGDKHYLIECKHHSDQGRKCDVKIPLYIHSRFMDVEKVWSKLEGHQSKFHQAWVFTNTRFTNDALQYGKCAGLMLVDWDHPKDGSLKDRIDTSGLHPLTCLTTLTKKEKQNLLSKELVLCSEICQQPELLSVVGISQQRHKNILKEARELCRM